MQATITNRMHNPHVHVTRQYHLEATIEAAAAIDTSANVFNERQRLGLPVNDSQITTSQWNSVDSSSACNNVGVFRTQHKGLLSNRSMESKRIKHSFFTPSSSWSQSTETYTSSSTYTAGGASASSHQHRHADQLSALAANASVGAITAESKWQQLERLLKRRFSVVTLEHVAETRERCNDVVLTETMSNKEACRFLDSVRHNIAQSEHASFDALHDDHCAHPLEDVNPYIIPIRDTFCYMAPSWGNRMTLFRFSASKSLQIFGPYNLLRKLSLYLITHKLFEMFILVVILINFVLLAGGPEWQQDFTSVLEPIFLGIFTFEAILRIIANGFFLAPYSYMRDVWNVLDLYIILVGVIGMIREHFINTTDHSQDNIGSTSAASDDVNLTGIRVIRVFRAVKVLALFPALRTTVSALGKVIRRLVPAVLLCFLFMWIVALMGIELFGGKSNTPMNTGCYDLSSIHAHQQRTIFLHQVSEMTTTSTSNNNDTQQQQQQRAGAEAAAYLCNMTRSQFRTSSLELDNNNASYPATTRGTNNYDFAYENDKNVTANVSRKNETNQLNIDIVAAAQRQQQLLLSSSDDDDYEFLRLDQFKSNGEENVSSIGGKKRAKRSELQPPQNVIRTNGYAALYVACERNVADVSNGHQQQHNILQTKMMRIVCLDDSGAISMTNFNNFASGMLMALRLVTGDAWEESLSDHMAIIGSLTVLFFAPVITFGTLFLLNLILAIVEHEYNSEVVDEQEEAGLSPISAFATDFYSTLDYHRTIHHLAALDLSLLECESLLQRMEIVDEHRALLLPLLQENPLKVADVAIQASCDKHAAARMRRSLQSQAQQHRHPLHDRFYKFRIAVRAYTESILFEFVIVVAIVLNTVILCTEHYQQPLALTRIQDIANLIFTTLFTAEACVKFIGQGFKYFNAGWNILDLVVVLISLLDFFLSRVGSLTALRTLRILRIFKLARSWKSMRHLINQTISTLSGIASVAFLLVVVIFIFAIVSTEMLGDNFNTGRWHFGDFGHSTILVTRIMLGNWLHPLHDCVASVPESASARATCHVVIIFEMLSGSLLFLNLFLALLLSKFSADVFKHNKPDAAAELGVLVDGGGEISVSDNMEQSSRAEVGGAATSSAVMKSSVEKTNDIAESESSSGDDDDDDDDDDDLDNGGMGGNQLTSRKRSSVISGPSSGAATARKPTNVLQTIRAFALGKRIGSQWLVRTRSKRESTKRDTAEPPALLPPLIAVEETKFQTSNSSVTDNILVDEEEEEEIINAPALALPTSLRRPLRLAQIVQIERERVNLNFKKEEEQNDENPTTQMQSLQPSFLTTMSTTVGKSVDDSGFGGSSSGGVMMNARYIPEPGETRPVIMPADAFFYSNNNHKPEKPSAAGGNKTNNFLKSCDDEEGGFEMQIRRPTIISVGGNAFCTKCRHSMTNVPNGRSPSIALKADSPLLQPLEVAKAEETSAIHDALIAAEKSCAAEIDAEAAVIVQIPQTKFRRFFFFAVNHWLYDCAVLFVILASSVCLVWEVTSDPPLSRSPQSSSSSSSNEQQNWQERIFLILNCCFTGFFTVEIIFNCLGRGARSYFTSGWDLLDLIIVLVSYADLIVTLTAAATTDLSTFRILRVLRAFRPLRAVKRWSGMRIVVNALLFSLPGIRDVLLLWIVFWTVFAIIGVQLFAGRLFRCVDGRDGSVVPRSVAADRTQCLNLTQPSSSVTFDNEGGGYSWTNAMINFDNVLNGYVAILQIATLEGWEELSLAAIDSPDNIGEQPTSENRTISGWIYIFCVILVNGMFVMQLLVGILVEKFQQLKRQYENAGVEHMMSETQKQMIKALKKIIRRRPASAMTSNNSLQRACTSVALSGRLDAVISVVIVVNMITSSLVHIVTNERIIGVVNLLEGVCTCAYVMEATVKVAGLHIYYFMDAWNCFDFAVTGISIAGVVTDLTHATSHGASFSLLRTFRLLRVARILRLVRLEIAQDVRTLLGAFVAGLPAVVNVLLLLFLIMFIFCIIGLSQFREPRASTEAGLNFNTFSNAMSWLFVLSTGAGWNDALAELSAMDNKCSNVDINCPVGIKAVLFVASYVFIVFLLLLNLLVGLVLEAYSNTHSMSSLLGEDDIDSFYHIFNHFDARRKQFIPVAELSEFLSLLEYPLKLRKPNSLAIRQLQVPIRELVDEKGKCRVVHAVDLLETMVRSRLGTDIPIPENIKQEIQRKFYEKWPQLLDAHVVSNTFFEPFVEAVRERIVQSDLFFPTFSSSCSSSSELLPAMTTPTARNTTENDGEVIINQLYQLLFSKGNVTIEKLRTLFLLLDARADEKTGEKIQLILNEIGGRPITYVQFSIMCTRHVETLSTDDVDLRNAFIFAAGIRSNTTSWLYVDGVLQPISIYGRDFARLVAAVGLQPLKKQELRNVLARCKLKRKSVLFYDDFVRLMRRRESSSRTTKETADDKMVGVNTSERLMTMSSKWDRETRELTLFNARGRDGRAQLYALLSNCGLLAATLVATVALMFV